MNVIQKGIVLMMISLAFTFSVNAATPDPVQNVRSTTHTLSDFSNESSIGMSWNADSITSTTVYYYYIFNTSSDYTINSTWNNALKSTTGTNVLSDDFSSSNGAYYFHIAAMVEEGWVENFSLTTTTKGPYYIDTKAPSNVSISGPETTNDQVVTLSLYADGATQMYISNSGYGIGGYWESYATSKQWTLTDGYETKTVYVLFRDAAGNATDGASPNARTEIIYVLNSAPEIKNLKAVASANDISAPNIYFDLYDKEGGDIVLTISSTNLTATTPDDITISGVSVSGSNTTYTISSITPDVDKALTMTVIPASGATTSTSSVITLRVADANGLTDTATVTFNMTEDLFVRLTDFSVTPKSNHALIQWQTTSEIDTAGFILKRSETLNGTYTKITDRLIPAKGSAIAGDTYSYQDFQIKPGKQYYYQLVEIDLNNNQTVYPGKSELKRNGSTEDDINYDANGDGDVNVGDVIYLLRTLTDFKDSE